MGAIQEHFKKNRDHTNGNLMVKSRKTEAAITAQIAPLLTITELAFKNTRC